jgi:hypothetical protein
MVKRMKQTSFIILFLCFAWSCAGQFAQMTAADKAGTTAKELTSTYLTLYKIADNITINGNIQQKKFMMEQVNPKMNGVKLALISIDKGVALWKDGGVDTMNVITQITDVQTILSDITKLINLITIKS